MNLGAWRIPSPKLLSGLAPFALAAFCALSGFLTGYSGVFPALGGPNGLLYDLTLRLSQPLRRDVATAPAVFVAVDEASLSAPEIGALPRALLQPIWARLIDGVLDAGARRIAFDMVFAFAGTDFQVGAYKLPGYDQSLVDSLTRNRDRVVLGRFPGTPPAAPFLETVGSSRVGVLDLQVESDGRVRSAAPLARLSNGRLAIGFAALGAGLSIRQAGAIERILVTPNAPPAGTPTYSLATLLDCLASTQGADRVREALAGRIVVVGTAVAGEDEHRGPTRFLGHAPHVAPPDRCAPHSGLIQRSRPDEAPGALLQLAAIQSAASERPVTLAPTWLRVAAAIALGFVFIAIALRDESALTVGEHDVAQRAVIVAQLVRSLAIGLAGPAFVGGIASAAAFAVSDLWLPMGYPILATNLIFASIVSLRFVRHRALFRRLYRTAGRYLPPARLVVLARSGFADPPEGQERQVSILLVDLIGFTTFSNQPGRTALEVVRTANQYFTLMQAAIDRHGGCSDKFLGDAVLAFWNGLSDEPEHALKALAAAHDIITAVRNADGSIANRLAARAVVCSGRVYVGDLGAKQRSNFTIIGPAVNETFRLERVPDLYGLSLIVAASTADLILASRSEAAAAQAIAGGVLTRVDDVELKGFSGARSVYAFVPEDDPGRAAFEAGRKALDRNMIDQGLAHLGSVESGVLRQAAKVVSDRYRPSS